MLEPSLPRFGNVGDKVVIRAVLHNATNTAGEADVEIAFDDLVRATETRKHVTLQPKADVPIDLPVEFVGTGLAKWRWVAHFHPADNQVSTRTLSKLRCRLVIRRRFCEK